MKSYNLLCAIFGVSLIFFYSLCMEQPENDNKQLISLITIIKNQQNILGYAPTQKNLDKLSRLKEIEKPDPKSKTFAIDQATHKQIFDEQKLEICLANPIQYINLIIHENTFLDHQINLITECFHTKSLYFLQQTINYNKKLLKQQQLSIYHQQTQQQSIPKKSSTPPISSKPNIHNKVLLETLEKKNNQINFTASTYKGLTYDYQAFLDCQKRQIPCEVNSPFINVEIILFDDNGNEISRNSNIPLPLPIFINDNGTIKKEIFLSLSKRPFIVNNKNVELLQKQLPSLAINFYNNIKNNYNTTYMNYLLTDNVIQQNNNTYVHGPNSSKPLLEEYFRLWGIQENEYKHIEEPQQPKEPQTGWLAKLQAGISTITTNIASFFRSMYRYFFG